VFGPVIRPFYSIRLNDVASELPHGYAQHTNWLPSESALIRVRMLAFLLLC
jgi:hypothetical protein